MRISASNRLQAHYFFNDKSHTINATVRNECEKELLNIFSDIASSLKLNLRVEAEPPREGGFAEFWQFIGDNAPQITLIISVATVIISRKPVENKKLTQLQIENLELDNELKRKELGELGLHSLKESNLSAELVSKVLDFIMLNYRITWRRSNFLKN